MDYRASASAFESARQLDPHRVEGMDMYSTVLWHLKRSVDLSYLAQEMQAVDRMAPQVWGRGGADRQHGGLGTREETERGDARARSCQRTTWHAGADV
eukprot:360298-Chlamydomonas_euryale.AAC.4